MPTKTFAISKDTLLAKTGSTALGGGADPHLPVGYYSGYHFRAALAFTLDWTGVTSITSAVLHIKTTGQTHVAFGSSPSCKIDRLTASFSENSAKGSADGGSGWSTSPSNYDDVVSWTTSGEASLAPGTAESTWKTVDITNIVKAWAPASIPGGGGATNYGIIIRPTTDGDSTDTTEFYGQESSYDPYIVLTYVSNTAPNAPTLNSPVGGARVTTLTPNLVFTHSDPQGDACASYDLQVSTDSSFATVTHWDIASQTSGISGNTITRAYAGTALSRGTTYYWRARTKDPSGLVGAWSAGQSFKVNSLPSATKTSPLANDLAFIHNLGSDLSVWTSAGSHAKARCSWSFSDADGDAQTAYQVRIYSASTGGTLLYDSGKLTGTATSIDTTLALVLGTAYYWTIEVWDTFDESSGESARTAFKVRWGQAIYEYAPAGGSGSTAWNFTAASPASNTQQGILFATATGASGVGRSAWSTDIGVLTPDAYVNILVRLASNATGTQPVLDSMSFSYIGSAVQPDHWTTNSPNGGDWRLDPSVRRFGSQSLRCLISTTSGNRYIYPYRAAVGDDVVVQPNTTYTLSAFVKTNATLASGAALRLMVYPAGSLATPVADGGTGNSDSSTTGTGSANEGWKRLLLTFKTGAGVTRIRPMVHYLHNGTTSGDLFWVDAMKLEEGTVATAWTPGFVGDPVVLDAGGVAIDGSAGGIFRLRGVSGGSNDTVELGSSGLIFGPSVEVYSPGAGDLTITGGGSASDSQFTLLGDTGHAAVLSLGLTGDSNGRALLRGDGTEQGIEFGPGNAASDVVLSRLAANSLGLASGDMLSAEIVGAVYSGGTAQTGVTAGSTATLAWGTKAFDTGNSYDSTNKRWVVPTGKAGVYLVTAHVNVVNQTAGVGNAVRISINGNVVCTTMGSGSTNVRGTASIILVLADAATITVTANPVGATADVALSTVQVVRLHAGAVMA